MPRIQTPLSLEYILLGLLHQQPGHGYDLHRRISQLEPLAFIWHIKRPSLYALLDKLETAGYIQAEIVPGEARPNQKRYSITSAGEQALQAWTHEPVVHGRDMRQEFLARLYFAYHSSPTDAVALLLRQEATCLTWLAELQDQLARLAAGQSVERAIFEFRIAQTEAMLQWLRRQQQVLV